MSELLAALGWPPEASRLAEARAELLRALTPSVTDAQLEGAYCTFGEARKAGLTQLVEAGSAKPAGSMSTPGAPAQEWDPVAAQALHLLGLGGDERGRAVLLDAVGSRVAHRPDATQAQVAWGIECLRDSRQLWHHLGDGDMEATVGMNLAAALYTWDYGDAYATAGDAEAVMREVITHYEGTPHTDLLAMAMTNLAVVLLKAATTGEVIAAGLRLSCSTSVSLR